MRLRRWIVSGTLTILVALGAAAFVYLRSESFQALASRLLRERIAGATGSPCTIEGFHLDLFTGRFELRGVGIGNGPDSDEPLAFSADRITGSLDWRILWSPRIEMEEMLLVRPRLSFDFARRRGRDPDALERIIRRSLDFRARRVELQEGWAAIDNRELPLSLALDDVTCELRYRPEIPAYAVRIGYRNGRVSWANRKLDYDLDARLLLMAEGLDVESMEVRRERSLMRGTGWLRGWSSPVILLHGDGTVFASELGIIHEDLAGARGEIEVRGNFRWDRAGFRSMGKFLAQNGSYRGAAVERVEGNFGVDEGAVSVTDAAGRIGGGRFQANGTFPYRTHSEDPKRVEITTRGIRLDYVARFLETPALAFENTVDSESAIEWSEGVRDLKIRTRVTLNPAAGPARARRTALTGEAEMVYLGGSWSLPRADLRSGDTSIRAEGIDAARFKVRMETQRLQEPLLLLQSIAPPVRKYLDENPDVLQATGTYVLEGWVTLRPGHRTEYEGALRIHGGHWRSYFADLVDAQVHWDGSDIRMDRVVLERGAEKVEGTLTLRDLFREDAVPDLDFSGSARRVSIASLRDLGLEPPFDVTGTINGTGKVSRTNGRWSGEGEASIERAIVEGEAFDMLRGRMEWKGTRLNVIRGEVERKNARAEFQGTFSTDTREMQFAIRLRRYPIREIPALRTSGLNLDGEITAEGRLGGTTSNPTLDADYSLTGLHFESFDLGRGKGMLHLADRILTGRGSVSSELGEFRVEAKVSTETGYPGAASVQVSNWNVRKIVPEDIPPFLREVSTALEGRLDIEGRFAEPSGLVYRGEIDGARFRIHDYELKNSEKIRFVASGKRVRLDQCLVVGEGTRLSLSGTIPIDETPGLNLRLEGPINLRLLEHEETKIRVSGSAELNVRATGPLRDPQIIGQAAFRNATMEQTEFPFPLTALEGDLTFSRNTVRLEGVRGKFASGTVQIRGTMEHQNAVIRSLNLQIAARGARLPYPKDFRTNLNADVILRGSADSQVLTGDIEVLRAEYVREFNLLEQLASRSISSAGPQVTDPLLSGIRFNVSIRSNDGLVIDNELMDLEGRISLTLRGTPAYPALTGRVEATEGSIYFRGNRFEIIRASADFVDQSRINPVFEVRAEADVKSYRLLLEVNGDLDKLRSNLRSDPPLATVDIVTLLATGRAREEVQSSRGQAEITGVSAASILSESLTGVLGKRVQRLFGLESFRVDPFLAGSENDPTARITITERLSRDLSITFSRNLSTNEEQIVVVEYDVSRNFSILATRDEDGKFGIEFRFRKRFR